MFMYKPRDLDAARLMLDHRRQRAFIVVVVAGGGGTGIVECVHRMVVLIELMLVNSR